MVILALPPVRPALVNEGTRQDHHHPLRSQRSQSCSVEASCKQRFRPSSAVAQNHRHGRDNQSSAPRVSDGTSRSSSVLQRVCSHRDVDGECMQQPVRRDSVVAHSYRWTDEDHAAAPTDLRARFQDAVESFNQGQYYTCHDVLEEIWQQAQEPQRGVIHGMLQCAVGMHHLLSNNHQGAMMEFGEGLNKLRRYTTAIQQYGGGSPGSPNHWVVGFEQEASAVLEFVYNTQLEQAACSEDACVTMDGSLESYRLLGSYGAGEQWYRVAEVAPFGSGVLRLLFTPPAKTTPGSLQSIPVPRLDPADADFDSLTW